MLFNYLKVALRHLWKNKGFSLINITGLALGLAAAMLTLGALLGMAAAGTGFSTSAVGMSG